MTKDINSNARAIKIEPEYLIQTRIIGKTIKVEPLLINGQICDCLLNYLASKNILLDYKPVSNKVFDKLSKHSTCKCKNFLRNKENRKTSCLCKKPNFFNLSTKVSLKEGEECFSFGEISNAKDYEGNLNRKTPKTSGNDNRIYLYFPRGKNIKEAFFYCPCMSGKDSKKIESELKSDKHIIEAEITNRQRSLDDEVDELILNNTPISSNTRNEQTMESSGTEQVSSEISDSASGNTTDSRNSSGEIDSSKSTDTSCSGVCECDSHENVLSENIASGSHENVLSENIASGSHENVLSENIASGSHENVISENIASGSKTEISAPLENKEPTLIGKEDEGIHEVLENYEANSKPLEKETVAEIKNISTIGKDNLNKTSETKKRKGKNDVVVNMPYGSDPNIGLSKQSNLSVTEEVDISELELNPHDSREPLFPSTIEIIPVKRNTFLHKLRESNLILAEGWLWKKRYFFSCLYHRRYFVLTKDAELIYFRDPYCVTGEPLEEQNQTEAYETTLMYPNTIPFNYNRLFDPSLSGTSGEVRNRTREIPVVNKYMCISNPKFLSLTDSMEIYRATCLTEAHPYKLVLKHASYNDQILFDTQSERDLWAARVSYIKKKYSDTRKKYIQSSVPTGRGMSSNTTNSQATSSTINPHGTSNRNINSKG